jgi:uncharacterized lipoprotein YmbA
MISLQARSVISWCLLLATCLAFTGCIGQGSPQVTYYSLLSMQQMGIKPESKVPHPDLSIGIGPVTLPDALKRIPLAVRDTRNVYHFNDNQRWVGTLEKDIATVLGDNLGGLLGTDKVADFPWFFHFKPTHRLIIDITQFDGELSGDAVLIVRWAIADREGTASLASGRSVYRQPVEGGDYAGLVRAESMLLGRFSEEMAREILGTPQPN